MNAMTGVHSGLGELLDRLPASALEKLVRQLILMTADRFADVPGVSTYHAHLLDGGKLESGESAAFEVLHEEFQQEDDALEEAGASQAESAPYFRKGCYAHALSIAGASEPLTASRVGSLLYDMGFGMTDSEAFWDMAHEKAQLIEAELSASEREASDKKVQETRRAHPASKGLAPGALRLWWWNRKIATIRPGTSANEIEGRFGPPVHRIKESVEVWSYPLKRIGDVQYFIRIALRNGAVERAYLAFEPVTQAS